jgi:hypothetical protein
MPGGGQCPYCRPIDEYCVVTACEKLYGFQYGFIYGSELAGEHTTLLAAGAF